MGHTTFLPAVYVNLGFVCYSFDVATALPTISVRKHYLQMARNTETESVAFPTGNSIPLRSDQHHVMH